MPLSQKRKSQEKASEGVKEGEMFLRRKSSQQQSWCTQSWCIYRISSWNASSHNHAWYTLYFFSLLNLTPNYEVHFFLIL